MPIAPQGHAQPEMQYAPEQCEHGENADRYCRQAGRKIGGVAKRPGVARDNDRACSQSRAGDADEREDRAPGDIQKAKKVGVTFHVEAAGGAKSARRWSFTSLRHKLRRVCVGLVVARH